MYLFLSLFLLSLLLLSLLLAPTPGRHGGRVQADAPARADRAHHPRGHESEIVGVFRGPLFRAPLILSIYALI